MDRVVVLGSGFVGSAVRDALESAGTGVVSIGISGNPDLADRDDRAVAWLRGRIGSEGARAVVNTAGLLRGRDQELHDANVAWPTWLARALTGTGVRLVHLGSAAEYGDPGGPEPVEETRPVHPVGPYGTTKWAGTRAVLAARERGLDAVVARGFNLVGPRVSDASPLYQFARDVAALGPDGGRVEVWWPPTVRDFVLTDDLAVALARLAVVDDPPEVVNVCSQVGIAFGDVVRAMAARRGVPVEVVSLDRPGIPGVIGSNRRLRDVCGLEPGISAALIAERVTVAG